MVSLENPLRRIMLPVLLLWTTVFYNAVAADRIISSVSLNPCMPHPLFSASLFNVTYNADKGEVSVRVNGISELSGNVSASLALVVYGWTALEQKFDPCELDGFAGMCPMTEGVIVLKSTPKAPDDLVTRIPGRFFGVLVEGGRLMRRWQELVSRSRIWMVWRGSLLTAQAPMKWWFVWRPR